jgi:hypothetical protein
MGRKKTNRERKCSNGNFLRSNGHGSKSNRVEVKYEGS